MGLAGPDPDGPAAHGQHDHGKEDGERRLGTPACRFHADLPAPWPATSENGDVATTHPLSDLDVAQRTS